MRALDAGLNLIDTAPAYEDGLSERIVGSAVRTVERDLVFVIDKIDDLAAPVAPQVDGSLARLGLDHADLFAFHAVSRLEDWEVLAAPDGGFDQLAACVRAGKARWRGLSSHHPDVLVAAIRSGKCDVVLFPIGPFVDERYLTEVLPLAREKGVGTVAFKTFGAGMLLGDSAGYGRPIEPAPTEPLPRLALEDCVRYTLTCDPDVALLGLSTPAEQDAAFAAARSFHPMKPSALGALRAAAARAVAGKGRCWWNPS